MSVANDSARFCVYKLSGIENKPILFYPWNKFSWDRVNSIMSFLTLKKADYIIDFRNLVVLNPLIPVKITLFKF